jgi:dihydroorotate dehydrogenase
MTTTKKIYSDWRYHCGDIAAALARLLPAETAHHFGIWSLGCGLDRWLPKPDFRLDPKWSIEVPGIGRLPHPLCLGAGFDKDALASRGLSRLGFAMIELGTVTPRPQAGNPSPRLFRYADQHAIINRMGFNSEGMNQVAARVERLRADQRSPLAKIGINLGKNKETSDEQAMREFILLAQRFDKLADYLVINLSSPNTPGLRGLARPEFVGEMALSLGPIARKTWIKFDPDTDKPKFQALIQSCIDNHLAGVVLTNTHRVEWPEPGGQSGHPLSVQSTTRLEWAHEVHQGKLAMIASGGVLSGLDAFHKIARGATAVQLWSALVYRGPWVVYKILTELGFELKLRGFDSVQAAVGSHYLK